MYFMVRFYYLSGILIECSMYIFYYIKLLRNFDFQVYKIFGKNIFVYYIIIIIKKKNY